MQLLTLLLTAGLAPLALAGYTLQDDYTNEKFFDMFGFDTVRPPSPHPETLD